MNNLSQIPKQIANFINHTVPAQYATTSRYTKVAGTICAIAAAEMALRSVSDSFSLLRGDFGLADNFSANLGGAVLYGLCSANLLPATPLIGGISYLFYSVIECDYANSYTSSKIIGKPIKELFIRIIFPAIEDFLLPIMKKVSDVFLKVLSTLAGTIIPRHPVWIAVTLLVSAIFTAKVVLPAIKAKLYPSTT